jgi:translation elongation factor EF-Tu-like GTPase
MAIEAPRCPNCGAPLTRDDKGGCLFCGVPLQVSGPAPVRAASPARAPSGDANGAFELEVEDTFSIRGRGTVATGRVASGTVRPGDELVVEGPRGTIRTRCKGVEMFRKMLDKAVAGDQVGLLLEGIEKDDIARGARIRAAK